MPVGDNFEDEPLTASRKASSKAAKSGQGMQAPPGSHTAAIQLEGMEEAMTKELRKKERRRKRRQAMHERTGKLVVLVCCCSIIAAIVVAIVMADEIQKSRNKAYEKDHATPAPSMAPTPAPAKPSKPTASPFALTTDTPTLRPTVKPTKNPTAAPTRSPAPTVSVKDEYILVPNKDTFVYQSGTSQSKTFGRDESFLVQNGLTVTQGSNLLDSVPDAFALVTFDMSVLPAFDRFAIDGKTATLRLTHKALELDEQGRAAAPITVSRLDKIPGLDVETINGASFAYPTRSIEGTTLDVGTTDTVVNIDVTDLVFSYEEDVLFFMLETKGAEQEAGDRFYSRESDTPPQLILSNTKP